MRSLTIGSLVFLSVSLCRAQPLLPATAPAFVGAGFANPFPIPVAPGQLLTLFVQSSTITNPFGFPLSAVFWNGSADEAMPVLQVNQTNAGCAGSSNTACANLLAVTVQIPFDAPSVAVPGSDIAVVPSSIAVSINGVKSSYFGVQPAPDQVHILTACDVILGGSPSFPAVRGLPCAPMITHSDGTQVSAILPAKAGEELVAYATGLGQTNPPLTLGQPATQSSPTVAAFNLDFNYRANALATAPGTVGSTVTAPLFTGATKGFTGLYQINFIVPPPPAGISPCVDFAVPAVNAPGTIVQSNLTVSVGSNFSFDGAGVCVTPSSN
jgi:uncharacterized protein (TIGR03437 family)